MFSVGYVASANQILQIGHMTTVLYRVMHRKMWIYFTQVACQQPVSLATGRMVADSGSGLSLQTRILRA